MRSKTLMTIFLLFSVVSTFGQQKMSIRESDGLRGKVKSVVTARNIIESKNYADNALKKLRDEIEFYDDSGVLTERIDKEYNDRTVYTLIDGELTSKRSQIIKTPTLQTKISGAETKSKKEEKPQDERYDLKYIYEFDNKGRIIELKVVDNTGSVFNKIVYKYDKNGVKNEELRYSNGTELNDQYFYKYDASGNLIEVKQVLHRPDGNTVSFYKYGNYKVDSQGNWIERVETGLNKSNGKELKRVVKYSRKIDYYK